MTRSGCVGCTSPSWLAAASSAALHAWITCTHVQRCLFGELQWWKALPVCLPLGRAQRSGGRSDKLHDGLHGKAKPAHALFSLCAQGTAKRWEQVAGYVRTRSVDEVLDMVKHGLKAGRFAPKQDSFAVAKKRQARQSCPRLSMHAVGACCLGPIIASLCWPAVDHAASCCPASAGMAWWAHASYLHWHCCASRLADAFWWPACRQTRSLHQTPAVGKRLSRMWMSACPAKPCRPQQPHPWKTGTPRRPRCAHACCIMTHYFPHCTVVHGHYCAGSSAYHVVD